MEKFQLSMYDNCGEKLSPKVHLWRKNDIYQVWSATMGTVLSAHRWRGKVALVSLSRLEPAKHPHPVLSLAQVSQPEM